MTVWLTLPHLCLSVYLTMVRVNQVPYKGYVAIKSSHLHGIPSILHTKNIDTNYNLYMAFLISKVSGVLTVDL